MYTFIKLILKKNPITTTNLWRKNSIWMLKGGIPFCLMIIIDNNKITLDQDLPPPPSPKPPE